MSGGPPSTAPTAELPVRAVTLSNGGLVQIERAGELAPDARSPSAPRPRTWTTCSRAWCCATPRARWRACACRLRMSRPRPCCGSSTSAPTPPLACKHWQSRADNLTVRAAERATMAMRLTARCRRAYIASQHHLADPLQRFHMRWLPCLRASSPADCSNFPADVQSPLWKARTAPACRRAGRLQARGWRGTGASSHRTWRGMFAKGRAAADGWRTSRGLPRWCPDQASNSVPVRPDLSGIAAVKTMGNGGR
jgi:hypothetical protein